MSEFDQNNQQITGNQYNAGGNINFSSEDKLEKQYRITLNWDKITSLRGFNLSNRNLESINLSGADLIEANFSYANLKGANFTGAKIKNADFTGADTSDVILEEANLVGSNITQNQLSVSNSLRKAILPDGSKYDGRYNLKEIDSIFQKYLNLSTGAMFVIPSQWTLLAISYFSPPHKYIANYYGINLNEYIQGQKWAHENQIRSSPFNILLKRHFKDNKE